MARDDDPSRTMPASPRRSAGRRGEHVGRDLLRGGARERQLFLLRRASWSRLAILVVSLAVAYLDRALVATTCAARCSSAQLVAFACALWRWSTLCRRLRIQAGAASLAIQARARQRAEAVPGAQRPPHHRAHRRADVRVAGRTLCRDRRRRRHQQPRSPQDIWDGVVAGLIDACTARSARRRLRDGGRRRSARLLAEHFPVGPDDVNELDDHLVEI